MDTNTALTTTTAESSAPLARVRSYLETQAIQKQFAEIMGERGAKSYISSVLIAVAENPALQKCEPDSIYIAALRAATLRLSVDNATGQAYLVPFNSRATLIVGYKGLHDMAVRTNRYRYINVAPICQGQKVSEDPYTGWHKLDYDKSVPFDREKVIGWLGAFEMINGYAHTLYMTVEEIHAHARKYSRGYDSPSGGWQKEPRKMERKTVLRLLLRRWGFLDPADVQALNAVDEDEVVDAHVALDPAVVEAAEAEDRRQGENPDPIPDDKWQRWRDLCKRADAVKVEHANPNRAATTLADLTSEYTELLKRVKAAEK